MAGVGKTVGEVTQLARTICECFVHILGNQYGADRQISRGERLGDAHGRWPNVHRLRAKRLARTPEPANDFIINKGNIVLVEYRLHARVVIFWWHNDATRAHDRLGDKGRHRLGSFGLDHLFQVVDQTLHKCALGFSGQPFTVVMRRGGMQNPGHG